MFNVQSIFSERLKQHLKLLNRYLRYIFNGHFMIAVLFAIVTIAIYYQQWLSELSPEFRADLLIAFVLAIVTMYNPIQTFLQEADKVFLIVQEKQMGSYFHKGLLYNFVAQLYIVLFTIAAITPLIQKAFPVKSSIQYIVLFAFVLLIKYGHLYANWWLLHQPKLIRMMDKFARFFLTLSATYFILMEHYIFACIIIVLLGLYLVNDFLLFKKQPGLHWEALIANDEQRLATFYQFVSMFAEVPVMKRKQKHRKWLSRFIEKSVSFQHEQTFHYLFRLTFIRSTEYINMFIRLTIIGGIAILFIPHEGLSVGIGIVFLYLTAFQLIPLYQHYRTLIWLDLYPVTNEEKATAFLQLVVFLCFIQTFLLACSFIGKGALGSFFLFLALGSIFNLLFHYIYVKKNILKENK